MVFGHLEVLHAKFHDRTISNLGDYVAQTDKQTDKQTDRQTMQYIIIYYAREHVSERHFLTPTSLDT